MPPTVKDINSQLQSALGAILELQQEVSLLKSSNKTLTEQFNKLLKRIGDSPVDPEWGIRSPRPWKKSEIMWAVWKLSLSLTTLLVKPSLIH